MSGRPPIRLAVVDDSAFVRKAIARMMEGEPDITIAGVAATGEELIAKLDEWAPSAVTLDLSMPGMGGLATLDAILAWRRVPVLILSGHSTREAPLAVEALHRGAVDFIDKQDFSLVDFQRFGGVLLDRLRAVVGQAILPVQEEPRGQAELPVLQPAAPSIFDIVLIGASTGGPPAIERFLESFPSPPPVPIAIVQHMPIGFTAAFAQRLNARLPLPVEEVVHNRPLRAGCVHVAASGTHLRISREGDQFVASLGRYPETQHRPSVDVLFRSAVPIAPRVIAVLLTGMGDDGAQGMLELAASGAMTIAQDQETSVVYGMPRAAMDLGAVAEQLPLSEIAPRVRQLLDSEGQGR